MMQQTNTVTLAITQSHYAILIRKLTSALPINVWWTSNNNETYKKYCSVKQELTGATHLGRSAAIYHLKQLELSRAHTPRAYTSAIARAVSYPWPVCRHEFDDPYLWWVRACAVKAAHGITGCGRKAWPRQKKHAVYSARGPFQAPRRLKKVRFPTFPHL